jgi:DmsE family decaheme c-type cytochrome
MKGVNVNRWRPRYLFSALLLVMLPALVNWSYAHDDEAHEAEHAQENNPGEAGGKGLGAKACLDCHTSSKVKAVMQTPHFVVADSRSPAANLACESCHGNSSEHAQFPKNIANIRFGSRSKHSAAEQSDTCLGCHQGDHINWVSSTHAAEDLSCASCHTVHAPRDKMLNKVAQTKTCLNCHREQHIEVNKPYRHPVKEGAVTCTGCHNPHGSNADAMLVKATVNETCYTCHAEKRGPFVNEHEPVQDDCTHCHTPHGSNHESLLAVRPPFLCQQCHSDHSHAREAYDFEDLPGGSGSRQSRVIGGSCVNCHSQIHGSNTPGARSMRQ